MKNSIDWEEKEIKKFKEEIPRKRRELEPYIRCAEKYDTCSIFNKVSFLIQNEQNMKWNENSASLTRSNIIQLNKSIEQTENRMNPDIKEYIDCRKKHNPNMRLDEKDNYGCIKNIKNPLLKEIINCTSEPCNYFNQSICYEQCIDKTLNDNVFYPWWNNMWYDMTRI